MFNWRYCFTYNWFQNTFSLSEQEVQKPSELTHKCISYFSLPFVHKEGSLNFRYFPVRISVRNLHHICIHLTQPQISKKNIKKMLRFQKTNFCLAKIVMWPKFDKPLFQWNCSLNIGSKKENIYTYTFMKYSLEKNYSVLKMAAKTSFVTLYNDANLC